MCFSQYMRTTHIHTRTSDIKHLMFIRSMPLRATTINGALMKTRTESGCQQIGIFEFVIKNILRKRFNDLRHAPTIPYYYLRQFCVIWKLKRQQHHRMGTVLELKCLRLINRNQLEVGQSCVCASRCNVCVGVCVSVCSKDVQDVRVVIYFTD